MRKFQNFIFIIFLFTSFTSDAQKTDDWLKQLFLSEGSHLLQNVLAKPDSFNYQIIYTQINRDARNIPHFKNFYINVDKNQYFNPASTVKLPTALAALEKMNGLKRKKIDKYSVMLTDSAFTGQSIVNKDTSSSTGLPSVAHYIKKIFLVSDNDAYNRLYEFTGQQMLNEMLRNKGFQDVRITRRFVAMTAEENKNTNPIRFSKNKKLFYAQPAAKSKFQFDFTKKIAIGSGHWNKNDSLIKEAMDFTTHNNLPLEDLQKILQAVLFPESVSNKQQFRLTQDDYRFLYHYMSAYPSESKFPNYDTTEFFDSYTKFFFKAGKQKVPGQIRIFNKTGWSYGFLTDAAYVADFQNNIEFMLTAVIYVNADGILNDNKYEYESIGYPFFRDLYKVIERYELQRKRKYKPDLNRFIFSSFEN